MIDQLVTRKGNKQNDPDLLQGIVKWVGDSNGHIVLLVQLVGEGHTMGGPLKTWKAEDCYLPNPTKETVEQSWTANRSWSGSWNEWELE